MNEINYSNNEKPYSFDVQKDDFEFLGYFGLVYFEKNPDKNAEPNLQRQLRPFKIGRKLSLVGRVAEFMNLRKY